MLSLFINTSLLASPIYTMQVYDRVLSSRNLGTLFLLTAIVVAFLSLYGILEYARSGILVRAGIHFEAMLRRPLFDTMMRAELSPIHRRGQEVIRDAETLRDFLSSGTAATLFDLPWTPIFVALCFIMHPVLGVVALVGAFVLFSLALVTEFATGAYVEQTNRLARDASIIAASALRNGDAVRGLGMAETVLERWSGAQSQVIAAHAIAYERSGALIAVSKFARVAVQTAIMCVGAWLAIEREISPGIMLAAAIIMGRALAPVEQTVAQWKRIVACRAAYGRLQDLFEALPAQPARTNLPAPVGRVEVDKAVVWPPHGNRPSVKGISLTLEPGESLAVIGASASGKSSLARALAGVWPVKDGTIRIDGASYQHWDPDKLGKHIGYLPQDVELFAGTVAENIARLGAADHDGVINAAWAAGAHDVIQRLPKGYDTPIGEGGLALSGGMRQRVGLARCLYGDPRIIILDEPNSNLDEEGERALVRALARMRAARRTVVLVTHRSSVLAQVDKVLVMSFGSALAFGPRDEVIARIRGQRLAVVHQSQRGSAAT